METLDYDKFGRPILNGGKGSGNFGHSGRPGLQGGSAGEGSYYSATSKSKTSDSKTLSGEEKYKLSQQADSNISKLSTAKEASTSLSNKNDKIVAKAKKTYEAEQKEFDEFYKKHKDDDDYDDQYYSRYDDGRSPYDFKEGLDNYKKFVLEVYEVHSKIKESSDFYSKEQEKEFSWSGSNTKEEKEYDEHLQTLAEHSGHAVADRKTQIDMLIKKYDTDDQKNGGNSAYNFAKEYANQDILKDLKEISKKLNNRGSILYLERNRNSMNWVKRANNLLEIQNGGKGSGNFGHAGIPGHQGGSAAKGSSHGTSSSSQSTKKKSKTMRSKMATSKKSAKDWYSEKYPGDYQKDEVPDKPIEKLTDKDIEHLDTQVRERIMKEKRKATGKQTFEDAEDAYYEKLDKTDYYDLDETLYGIDDPASDELRYSLVSLTSQYSALLHGEVRSSAVKEYKKGLEEAIKDSEKYADQLKDEDLKKRAKELIDFIKDAPTDFKKNSIHTRLDSLLKITNGGKGSRNFGHSGRPGLQGGSAGSGSSTTKSTSKKGSKSDSQTMTKDQKAKLAEVGKELGMTISVFEDAYNDASKRLGEIEQDYATEYDDDSYDEFGRWKETDIDDYGDPELSKAESLAEDLEDLSEGLKRIKSKYDSAMSKDYLSKDQMGKFLEDAYKTVEKYQDEYDSEMNISDIVIHVAEELYIVKTTIKKAQESLKAEKDSKN